VSEHELPPYLVDNVLGPDGIVHSTYAHGAFGDKLGIDIYVVCTARKPHGLPVVEGPATCVMCFADWPKTQRWVRYAIINSRGTDP
jgi:hypothetical protein